MSQGTENGNQENSPSKPNESSGVEPGAGKPGLDAVNDLAALLSRAALSESQYREFSPQPRADQQSQSDLGGEDAGNGARPSTPVGTSYVNPRGSLHFRLTSAQEERSARNAAPESVSASGGDMPEALPPLAARANANPAGLGASHEGARSGRTKFDAEIEPRWSVLGRAFSGELDESPGQLIRALAGSVSLPIAVVAAISGGTGVTTILATLARCFASRGQRVLLADHGSASLLPLYFGASDLGAGELKSFSMPSSGGGVETLNRGELDSQPPSLSAGPPAKPEKAGLVSKIRNAAARSNRLLLDPGTLSVRAAEALCSAGQFGLVPLVPDLSCVCGLLRLEQALQRRETKAHPRGGIYYVLNKFDSSLPLHRDIKASLESLLGGRLLPMTLRRSDAVAEALADGMTVIDYCPEAEIAGDFMRLADWLLESAPTPFRERTE